MVHGVKESVCDRVIGQEDQRADEEIEGGGCRDRNIDSPDHASRSDQGGSKTLLAALRAIE
jgi:hypothetical protein